MTATARSQRWQRRKEARPAELLEAALDIFFEKGFAAARLDDIAARAGVSKGTVYLYYHSKEDVFEALIRAIPQANVEIAQKMIGESEEAADVLLERMLRFMSSLIQDEKMQKFPRLIIGEAGRFPKLAQMYKDAVISRGIALLSSVIERGIKEGQFRKIDPRRAAYAALAPLLFGAIWRTTFERFDDEKLDAGALADQHIETFLRGIRREGTS